jgi:integrase/recombinase XerD
MSALAPTLQSFFASYLCGQRAAGGHTIAAYRDTFRLLLGYVEERTGVRPSKVDISQIDAEVVGEFLTMLEQRRGNSTRTRNARLAAIHSLFPRRTPTPRTRRAHRTGTRDPVQERPAQRRELPR